MNKRVKNFMKSHFEISINRQFYNKGAKLETLYFLGYMDGLMLEKTDRIFLINHHDCPGTLHFRISVSV